MTARSPSSALAIVDETGARGKFTTLVLLVTILMDVTVIVLYDINAMIAEIQLGGTCSFIVLPLYHEIISRENITLTHEIFKHRYGCTTAR